MPQQDFALPISGEVIGDLDRVRVAIMFVDIVESTELTERLGDLEAYWRVDRSLGQVRRCAESMNGTVLEVRGDGALLAFDDVGDALECGRRILARCVLSPSDHLPLRLGLHVGFATRTPHGYFGRNVVLASRLSDGARPNEFLVSEAVRQGAPGFSGEFDRGREVRLKGFAGAHLAFGVLPTSGRRFHLTERRSPRATGSGRSPVGFEGEAAC